MKAFLSYHSPDRHAADLLATALANEGIDSFLAPWSLQPGCFWLPQLAYEIKAADLFVLLIGTGGVGPWQLLEYYEALDRKVRQPTFPLVPVLAGPSPPRLPFLHQLHTVSVTDLTAPSIGASVVSILGHTGGGDIDPPWRTTCPYRGLLALTEADAAFFFGRERETAEVLQRLAGGARLVMLIGASGTGKSSIQHAGVISALRRQAWPNTTSSWPATLADSRRWLYVPVQPREQPLTALVRGFVTMWYAPDDPARSSVTEKWVASLAESRDLSGLIQATADVMRERFGTAPPEKVVLVIDQWEELYQRRKAAPGDERDGDHRENEKNQGLPETIAFASILQNVVARRDVLIVGSLRSDFYTQFQNDQALFSHSERVDVLAATRPEAILPIIEKPTRALNAHFINGDALAIAQDVARQSGGTPILAYVLEEMWHRMQQRGDGQLRLSDYRDLGGVKKALMNRLRDYMAQLDIGATEALKDLFIYRLATTETRRDSSRRRAFETDCTKAEWAHVAELTRPEWRLLTTDEAEGRRFAEVAHEDVLRIEGFTQAWIDDDRGFLEWKSRLEAERAFWEQLGGKAEDLPHGRRLETFQRGVGERRTALDEAERTFLARSELRALEEQKRANKKLRRALAGVSIAVVALLAASAWAWYQTQQARREKERAQKALAASHVKEATTRLNAGSPTEALPFFAAAVRLDPSNAAIRAAALDTILRTQGVPISLQHQGSVYSAAFSADGTRVVTASDDRTARVWDARTGQPLGAPLQHEGSVYSAAFSRDGARVVTASWDNTARVWDARTGEPLGAPLQHGDTVTSAVFSADGTRVVTASRDDTARVWDARTGEPLGAPLQHGDTVTSAAFSADGTRVVTASRDDTARVWDARTGQPVVVPLQHGARVTSAAFSGDGTRVVTASDDHTARVWDARTGQPLGAPLQHGAPVTSAAFSGDGTRVVTASDDHTARVWDARTGEPLGALLQHGDTVTSAAFSADGTRVVTASWDHTARMWDARTGQRLSAPLQHGATVASAAFSGDGTRVVTASGDNTARVWDARMAQPLGAPLQHGDTVTSAMFSADGARVVTASGDRTARVWDARTGQPLGAPLHHGDTVTSAAFSADGSRVVTASDDHTARVWDARTGQPLGVPLEHWATVTSAAFSADGTRVVTASRDHTVRVWDARTGQAVGAPLQHEGFVTSAAFSADGTRVVTASGDRTARVWDAQTGQPLGAPLQHGDTVTSAAFSADGSRVVTASGDRTARVWEARTGQPLGAPLQHRATVTSAAFSADGTRVVTASGDRTARVWEARTGQPLGAPLQHGDAVTSAAFSGDGTRVVTASADRTARVWDARTGQPVGAPLQHGAIVTSAAFNADATRVVTADEKTARVWDVAAGKSRDAGIIAEAAEALSEYTVNDASSLIRVDNAAVRVTSLRQRLAHAEFVEASATWMLHWFFEDSWDRTVSPLSAITVNDYIIERLKRCTYEARSEVESHFVGHPLLLKLKEFCPGTAAPNADSTSLSPQRRR